MSQFSRAADAAGCAWPDEARRTIAWCWATERRPGTARSASDSKRCRRGREVGEHVGDVGVRAAVDEDLVEALVGDVRGGRVAAAERGDERVVVAVERGDVRRVAGAARRARSRARASTRGPGRRRAPTAPRAARRACSAGAPSRSGPRRPAARAPRAPGCGSGRASGTARRRATALRAPGSRRRSRRTASRRRCRAAGGDRPRPALPELAFQMSVDHQRPLCCKADVRAV